MKSLVFFSTTLAIVLLLIEAQSAQAKTSVKSVI